jgi:sporulation protein YlmC with PRC-barrel domain
MAEDQMAPPKSDPGLPPPPPAAAEPAPAPSPKKEAANPAPAPAPQQQAEVPAEVVITELTAVDDGKKLVKPWALPAERIAEMDVYDANGKKIGEVDAVLQDKKGEIKGVAVVHGGFLGFGSKDSIITLDRLKLKDGDIVTELTEDQLDAQLDWTKK